MKLIRSFAFAWKIQPHRKIIFRLTPEQTTHIPTCIKAEKISQQCTPGSKAITTGKRTDSSCFYLYINRRCIISHSWPGQFISLSIPCSTKINKLNYLEISQKSIIDWFIKE